MNRRVTGTKASTGRANTLFLGILIFLGCTLQAHARIRQETSESPSSVVSQETPAAVQERLAEARAALRRGEPETARSALSQAWEVFERLQQDRELQEDSGALGMAGSIAELADAANDFALAANAWRWIVEENAGVLAAGDMDLQAAKLNLGAMLSKLGEEHEARLLWEDVLEVYAQKLPAGDQRMISLQMNLSIVIAGEGDRFAARTLLERARAALHKARPEDAQAMAVLHAVLASQVFEMGDVQGADALFEGALVTLKATLSVEHDFVLQALQGFAATRHELGDSQRALQLFEEILATRESVMPENSLQLLLLRNNVAEMLAALGDLESARELLEEVAEVFQENYSAGSPDRLLVQANLAQTRMDLGELQEARVGLEEVLQAFEERPTGDVPALVLSARASHCQVLVGLGLTEEAHGELERLARDLEGWIAEGQVLAPREALEHAASAFDELSLLLSLGDLPALSIEPARQFELVEAFRAAATGGVLREGKLSAEAQEARTRARQERGRIQELAVAPREDLDARRELQMAVLERDRFESTFRKQVIESGMSPHRVTANELSAQLGKQAFAAGYRVYQRTSLDAKAPGGRRREPALLAFVVFASGDVQRVELGSLAQVSAAVTRWRESIGAPVSAEPGAVPESSAAERAAALKLRAIVLDPLLALGSEFEHLHVCLDGPLHLVPLNALLAGERADTAVQIHSWVTFAELQDPRRANERKPSMLVMGGVDYGHVGELPEERSELTANAEPGVGLFPALRGTAAELEAITALFHDATKQEASVLRGSTASKRRFEDVAPDQTYLHLATHGFITDERVRSWSDSVLQEDSGARRGTADPTFGMAPMTLCGLAFAGANLGASAAARTPGLMTAEEFAGLDLSNCELAVLSACETHVGLARAGQGLQSIHGALHVAGVRTTVSSLWKVNDELTRELMVEFYTHLWSDRMSKADALAAAQAFLRRKRHATRDWAGWVLIGDPR